MEVGGFLEFLCNGEKACLVKESPHEADACRGALLVEAIRHDHARMPGEVCEQQVVSLERWCRVDVNGVHQACHLFDNKCPDPVRLNVFHGRNEP